MVYLTLDWVCMIEREGCVVRWAFDDVVDECEVRSVFRVVAGSSRKPSLR